MPRMTRRFTRLRPSPLRPPRRTTRVTRSLPASAATAVPSSVLATRSTASADGTWVQQDSTNLENYMDAVIHDGIIEVTYHLNHESWQPPSGSALSRRRPATSATFRAWTARS